MLLTDVFLLLYLKAELRANVFLALEEQESQKVSACCVYVHVLQPVLSIWKHA